MAYPYTSGTAYTTYATLIQMKGLDKALDWWEKFDKQSIHQYTKSGTGCIPLVGLGEVAVGISFSHDILAKGVNKGYPVVMTFPAEGTGYEIGGLSLIKGGPEPELGSFERCAVAHHHASRYFKHYPHGHCRPDDTFGHA